MRKLANIIKQSRTSNQHPLKSTNNYRSTENSITSEKHNDFGIQFSDKSQLDADDEEPNKESY